MNKLYYIINKKDIFDLFSRLSSGHRVLVPYSKGEKLYFSDFDARKEDKIELGGIRQSQPAKSFFINPAREKLSDIPVVDTKPVVIAGVKGCDLSSLKLQDHVFLQGDSEDPFYAGKRQNTLIIGNDCTYARETCFCIAMEGAPYPKVYFDISLSPIDNRFLVEVGTAKGQALIDDFKLFFKPGTKADIEIRDRNRQNVSEQVMDYICKRNTPNTANIRGAVRKNYDLTQLWQDFASTCVECGACNLVCPTCHCFLIYDEDKRGAPKRFRAWDACLYKTFARVAGGANPRRHLYERLRNRFEKKFDFFPQVLDYFACTGCGRCIEACPGDIDIREVLKGLVSGAWNKPPND